MAFPEGNKLFAGDLRANLDERKRWYGSVYKEIELEMDCLWIDSSDLYVTSSYDSWAKYKEKVPNVLDPNQNVDTTCNSKLKFT